MYRTVVWPIVWHTPQITQGTRVEQEDYGIYRKILLGHLVHSLLPDHVSSANARRDDPRLLGLPLLAVVLHRDAAVRGGGYRAHPPQIPVVSGLRRRVRGVAALEHVHLFCVVLSTKRAKGGAGGVQGGAVCGADLFPEMNLC